MWIYYAYDEAEGMKEILLNLQRFRIVYTASCVRWFFQGKLRWKGYKIYISTKDNEHVNPDNKTHTKNENS